MRTSVPDPDPFMARYLPMGDIDEEEQTLQRLSLTAMMLTMAAFATIFLGILAFAHLS